MRNRLKYCIAVVLSCLLIPTTANTQIQKLYLYPKAAGSEKQSKFVDSIRFIPLEIKEGIQLGAYDGIEVTENYFLLMDYSGKNILLYSKSGAFIKKINFRRLGEGFYPAYNQASNQIVFFGNNKNYTLTPKDFAEIRLDWNNPRNKKYFKKYRIDLNDTAFTIEKDSPDENDIIHAYPFYDEYYWQGEISTSPLYKEGLDYEFKIYKNKKPVKSFFPYNSINEPRFLYTAQSTTISETDTPFIHFITRPYCDTIYKIIKDSLFPVYQLVLPLENSLPASFFNRPFKNKTERENFQRNNGSVFRQIYSFYETPQSFFFSISYFSNYESYIYQKQGNITYKTRNIKPDSSQYNLKLLADYGIQKKGDRFYKPQKAGDLLSFFEQNKNVPVPKELVEFIKRKPPGTTPVIVEFKLKDTP